MYSKNSTNEKCQHTSITWADARRVFCSRRPQNAVRCSLCLFVKLVYWCSTGLIADVCVCFVEVAVSAVVRVIHPPRILQNIEY